MSSITAHEALGRGLDMSNFTALPPNGGPAPEIEVLSDTGTRLAFSINLPPFAYMHLDYTYGFGIITLKNIYYFDSRFTSLLEITGWNHWIFEFSLQLGTLGELKFLTGNNTVTGNSFNDLIRGDTGFDTLRGLGGADTLRGDEGDDRLEGGSGSDILFGDLGFDLAAYSGEAALGGTQGISVDLLTVSPTSHAFIKDTFGNFDFLLGIEGVIGSDFADVMYGSNDGNRFTGLGGADQFVGWGGADTMDGGAGDDVMLGWTGNDSLLGGTGNDWLWAGDGNDTASGSDGADVLVGDLPGSAESGADSLAGGTGADILLGGAGNDTLLGGADSGPGSDFGAQDWLTGGAGSDLLAGGSGDDVIWEELDLAEGGNDTALGGDGQDLILAGSGADSLDGGAGNDTLYGGAGADTILGGAGGDWIWIRGASEFGDVLQGFTPGQDKLVIYAVLGGAMSTAQAFATGRLALAGVGADTELRHDAGGPAAVLVARFQGIAPGALGTATDFI